MIIDDAHEPQVEEENYFVSMTDMMVGMIFIFIILLMYYALQFRTVTDQLTGADETRAKILHEIQSSLKSKGVEVTIDTQDGVLRLPDAILFDSGQAVLKPGGAEKVAKLAATLGDILPCYTDTVGDAASTRPCPTTEHRIESVYIEGHTDKDPLSGGGLIQDNWDLSVVRATNTYRSLVGAEGRLTHLCARKGSGCAPVLSVSGYGDRRPVKAGDSNEDKSSNRRIDIRLIMVTPDRGNIEAISREVEARQ
ncbi:hypothetical protein ABAC460_09245 [Asticcacaulis sp. AC460]|uniref:OmpA/MotB family protein n=1 Tax=Asticcacaulis sp. AC460 TaxID=1282360 RepID=UPI0003C3E97A|nr:OmpA family protein [Asticcacaulis sp. AC460]ESQ90329.1 hypothetical protein ABAC460_09245 [Asticcacaulis sp. AC460]